MKKVAHKVQLSGSLMFLSHFDIFCNSLLSRQTHSYMKSICFNMTRKQNVLNGDISNISKNQLKRV